MTKRFLSDSTAFGLVAGCGLLLSSLQGKSQENPQKDFSSNAVATTMSYPKKQNKVDKSSAAYWGDAPARSRLSLEVPFACRHSYTEWWGREVKFNENNNYGAIVNYAFLQSKRHDLAGGIGLYTNSIYRMSKIARLEWTYYFGKTNRFQVGAEADLTTYQEDIEKDVFIGNDGKEKVTPVGAGEEMFVPAARIKAGYNVINNSHFRMGVVAGYIYDPSQKMSITSMSLVIAPGKGRRLASKHRQNSSDMYYADNNNTTAEILPPLVASEKPKNTMAIAPL